MTGIEGDLADEISATNADFVALDNKLASEVTSLEGVDAGLNTRITSLEGAIQEDFQQVVEKFVGGGLIYDLANPVQDDNKFLVDAYINGHHVEVAAVNGANVEILDPGYGVDADDVVMFVYQH